MQALLIYVLMRLDEGATDYNNFDALLLKAVTVGLALVACIYLFLRMEYR